ncbi:hypothetical protein [Desulfurivibrio dismutans]|uniref:hypothetical protein n=1 Tax=Desulfurivibrio dismutans TaxID=1398908 RepID=UPI0023DB6F7B|nr:hypothetical protein [Desulfurivibrio alkaliphilus]MDF1613699.1 hypothetical protein [Desulfurivibrio alkaliphilus]
MPEQMFVTQESQGEAISAVKALQKAAAQGQRIYHITKENQAEALPNIHQGAQTMDEIRTALAVGKEVIVHTDPVSVPGWQGAGYVITDPYTGAGAWKIGGGANGSFTEAEIADAGLTLLSVITDIASFLAKAGVALAVYMTALEDVSKVIAGVSAVLTGLLIYHATDSHLKGVGAFAIDLMLTVLASLAAKAMFGLLVTSVSPVLASVFVVLSVAFVVSRIKTLIMETYFLTRNTVGARFARHYYNWQMGLWLPQSIG